MGEITQTANDHCLILTLETPMLNLLQTAISLNNDIIENTARDNVNTTVTICMMFLILHLQYFWESIIYG